MRFILVCAALAWVCVAYTFKGELDVAVLPLGTGDYGTTVVLDNRGDGSRRKMVLRQDGKFQFANLSTGVYSAYLESVPLESDMMLRVDITEDEGIKVHQVFAGHDFESDLGPEVAHPVTLRAKRTEYLMKREEFSVFSMLKSPMMLMSLVSLVMVFLLPKLTENMDPEALKELQDRQARSTQAAEKVQNFDMAAYMASKGKSKK
ncbi:hypothetical protein TRVA0_008S01266 [Trichomonascus vanleenenianus]|uniref:uncharacterized protein n=1 Tax=Trichomonascus vanleenenianus TaxID=2268995 RepID=UPI003EC9720C